MGCDIHFFVEHKSEGKWNAVPPPDHLGSNCEMEWDVGRDYELFALLGNNSRVTDLPLVRKKEVPFPDEISTSALINLQFDNIDDYPKYHSHNWLSLKELLEFNWNSKFRDGSVPEEEENFKGSVYTCADRFRYFLEEVIEPMKGLDSEIENVRCIYAFDD